MPGIKFEGFAKFIFECVIFIHMWVYLFALNYLSTKEALLYIITKSKRTPKPDLYAALVDGEKNSYLRIYVWIVNFMIKFRIPPFQ